MKNELDILKGAIIKKIEEVEDYWRVHTDRGCINIYNPVKFENDKESNILISSFAEKINGQKIKEVKYKEAESVIIILNNEYRLNISLSDEDYRGPEAMDIISSKLIVIN